MNKRNQQILLASIFGIIGNLVLSLLKITVGIIGNSISLLADGIDSAIDVATSGFAFYTVRIMKLPPSAEFPYGRKRAETIASKTIAFVTFFVGAQLCLNTFKAIFFGSEILLPSVIAFYAIGISILGKGLLSFIQFEFAKKTKSILLKSYAKNMLSDVGLSFGVLIGLLCTYVFDLPIVDRVAGFFISIWIMKTGIDIIRETSTELMDGITDTSLYDKVFSAALSVKGASKPHKVRIRKIGYQYVIELDVEVSGLLSVTKGHDIARKIGAAVRNSIDNVYDVLVHIEPEGNPRENEEFGVNEGDV